MSNAIQPVENVVGDVTSTLPVEHITLKEGEERFIKDGNVIIDGGVPRNATVHIGRGLLRVNGNVEQGAKIHSYYAPVIVSGSMVGEILNCPKERVIVMGDVYGADIKAGHDIIIGGKVGGESSVQTEHGAIRIDGDMMLGEVGSRYNRVQIGGDVRAGGRVMAEHGGIIVKGTIHPGAVVLGKHSNIQAGSVSEHAVVGSALGDVAVGGKSHARINSTPDHGDKTR